MIFVIIRRIWGAFKPFYKKIVFDNIFAIAGQSAFFLILSSVPLLMFSVSILQSMHLSAETLGDFLGDTYSSTQISDWLKSLTDMYTAPTSISIITLIATLWSGRRQRGCTPSPTDSTAYTTPTKAAHGCRCGCTPCCIPLCF